MSGRGARAVLVGVLLTGFFAVVEFVRGGGLTLGFVGACALGLLVFGIAYRGWDWVGALRQASRERMLSKDEGRHHQFAGVRLRVEEHGHQVWLGADGLRRALGPTVAGNRARDTDDVLAARHAGQWRRAPDGALLLRVEAVVQQLSSCPEREDPRVQRLRRYLERDVLFPAQRRREVGRSSGSAVHSDEAPPPR